jgi:phospholipase C
VSAYTDAGSVINDVMHHGSVISTLCELHGLAPISRRDDGAPSLRNAITRTVPRQPALWPDVHRPFVPPNPEAGKPHPATDVDRNRPLTAPALGLIHLLLAKYEPDAPTPRNYGDAYDVLHRHGDGLFGTHD